MQHSEDMLDSLAQLPIKPEQALGNRTTLQQVIPALFDLNKVPLCGLRPYASIQLPYRRNPFYAGCYHSCFQTSPLITVHACFSSAAAEVSE